jgi:hypothetical protein
MATALPSFKSMERCKSALYLLILNIFGTADTKKIMLSSFKKQQVITGKNGKDFNCGCYRSSSL